MLISGRGSNMIALAKAAQNPDYPADILLVISNRPGAPGLEKARNSGLATATIDHTMFNTRCAFEEKLHLTLQGAGIELICCAGFMRILSPWFVRKWPDRILNIHPSLLPKYKGLVDTHKRALEAGDPEHGCTVHYVTDEVDGGAILAQSRIPVLPDDTAESLADRLIEKEHALYAAVLSDIAAQTGSGI